MIYFDNAATTPLSAAARKAVLEASEDNFGNPSSPHGLGIAAERTVRSAADSLSLILGCLPDEIIFTSGGTESNNLAILGIASRFKRRGGHILSTPMEHPSVVQPLKHLSEEGITITYAPVSEWPVLIRPETFMVSFSQVCNETGDINDVTGVTAMLKQRHPEIIIHVDGAQGFCKESAVLAKTDIYTFSAHKLHGLMGVGGLMLRKNVRLAPLLFGGGQQAGLRPGTENVPGIASLAAAAEDFWRYCAENHARVSAVRYALSGLSGELPDTYVNQHTGLFSPYILNMSFLGVKGETLVNYLSEKEIYCATGAACRSKKNERSPLYALGYDDTRVSSAVRFSFSPLNTVAEAEIVKQVVMDGVRLLRRVRSTKK